MSDPTTETSSPVSKEDGSNKRIIPSQGATDNPPAQPIPLPTPSVATEVTLVTTRQDGTESQHSNPDHNPHIHVPEFRSSI